jgi:exosome complex RNA-binding protein Csl4
MEVSNEQLVMPGDKLAMEEEAVPSDNTYSEEGIIYSSIIGKVKIDSGKISVHSDVNEIRKVMKDMLVLATVTDDLPAVSFVKIGPMQVKGVKYIAIHDGKILVPKPREDRFRGRDRDGGGFGGGRGGRTERFEQPQKLPRLCGVGDVIIARVLEDAGDLYLLGVRDPECGVVQSSCELCDHDMRFDGRGLACTECKHRQMKKISQYYGKTEEIKRLFK